MPIGNIIFLEIKNITVKIFICSLLLHRIIEVSEISLETFKKIINIHIKNKTKMHAYAFWKKKTTKQIHTDTKTPYIFLEQSCVFGKQGEN